ncbi:MAG: hypothetical protein IT445_08925 [Phycisphaeraceae bacterium]|nr:hypothetical protein [Phycisphaeraceae bacterium]
MSHWLLVVLAMGTAATADPPPTEPAADLTPTSSVRLIANIDVKDFGAETLRIGDLNADGEPDLLLVQCVYGSRQITCLTALSLRGDVLWQSGQPSADNGRIYSDLPVQIYDWDADGHNDVLYVRQAKYVSPAWDGKSPRERADEYEGPAVMVVLDGETGREKSHFDLPAPADDSFLFADLTGQGRRQDLVVKDRYWNMWGISHEGQELWRYTGSTGHYPAIGDVDDDGRDEVFVGFALVDDEGKVLFQKDAADAHQDACWILRAPDGKWRLLFGNSGLHCLMPDGTELWSRELREAQHVVAGRFRLDSALQLAAVDRRPVPGRRNASAWSMLYLYDLEGREIWRRQQEPGSWASAIVPVHWSGSSELDSILVYDRGTGRPVVLYNGQGEITDTLAMQYAPYRTETDRQAHFCAIAADVWGDCRDEILIFGPRGLCIYANTRSLLVPTLYNETLYPGM